MGMRGPFIFAQVPPLRMGHTGIPVRRGPMSQRKQIKWSIERATPEVARPVGASSSAARKYPTLAELRSGSAVMRSGMMGSVQKLLAPILVAGMLGSAGCANVAQADDPVSPPHSPPPLGGAPMPAHIDPPPPPPPPPPPARPTHPRVHHHRPNPNPGSTHES